MGHKYAGPDIDDCLGGGFGGHFKMVIGRGIVFLVGGILERRGEDQGVWYFEYRKRLEGSGVC